LEINFLLAYRQGLQLDLMGDRGWLSAPFLGFAWLEQIGELFDGEYAFPLVLAHYPCCDRIEQTEVVLLLGLH
jgi:hypothetical protein